jgi:hypothetical protein
MEYKTLNMFDTELRIYPDGTIYREDKRIKKNKVFKLYNQNCLDAEGYARDFTFLAKHKIRVHRLIYKAFNPEWNIYSHLVVDHKNGIRNDNRIDNLQSVTISNNNFNVKHKGYTKRKKKDGTYNYQVTIREPNGNKKHLGMRDTEEEASKLYEDYKIDNRYYHR